MLILEDTRHNKIAPLPNAKDVKIERDLSGNDTLSFSYAMGVDTFYPLIQPQGFIVTPDQEYVIKEVNPGEENYCDVVAVVNTEDLKSTYNNAFVRENVQLTEIANNALVGTGWTVDTNVTKLRSLSMTNSTPLDILKKLAETYTCDIYFDAKNKVVKFSEVITNGVSNAYFVDRLNLASLQVQNTSYDFCTRLIPVGKDNLRITDVNAGLEYVENYGYSPQIILAYWQADQYTDAQALKDDAVDKLELLSKPAVAYKASVRDLANLMPDSYSFLKYQLGDFIRVVDSEKQIMEIVRIVKATDYPFDPENNEVELNSRYEQLEDLQIKFQQTADSVDTITTPDGAGVSGEKIDGVDWTKVQNVQVTNAQIQNLAVDTAKIKDLTVTTAKIADLSVTNAKIVDATITNVKIHDLSADKITAGTIDANFIRVINLNADWINAGTINANLIGARTITADKIAANSITATEMKAGTITADSGIIADAAIGNAQIQNLAVTGAKIATATIDTANIKNGAITTALIETGAVNTAQIADGSITDAKIVSLTASKITAGTLDAGTIDVINLNAANITVGTINGQQIAPGAIDLNHLGTDVTGEIDSKATQEDINVSVDGIQIGGRNLLLNSNFANGFIHWKNNGATYTIMPDDIFGQCCKVVAPAANKGIYQYFSSDTETINNYTISGWLKADTATTINFGRDYAQNVVSVTTEWQRFIVTISSNTRLGVIAYNQASSGTFYIANVKVERGNKATDWTPAPEDIQQQFTDLNTDLQQIGTTANGKNKSNYGSTAPTNPTVGDLWFKPNGNGIDPLQWDGSNWINRTDIKTINVQAGIDTINSTTIPNAINTANGYTDGQITTVNTNIQNVKTTADGKNTVYRQSTQPTGSVYKTGDLWFDTTNDNRVSVWNGSSWILNSFGNTAIANLDAGKINTGTLAADRIAANSITGNKLVGATITGDKIAGNTITASNLVAGTITAASGVIGSIDAGVITTGTLSADRIAANSIGGDKITANSIAAKNLYIGDYSNLCLDPQLVFGDWGTTSIVNSTDDGVPANAPTPKLGVAQGRDTIYSDGSYFRVIPGEIYYLQCTCATLDSLYNFGIGLWLQNTNNSNTYQWPIASSHSPIDTWTTIQGYIIIPQGYTKARLWLQINSTSNFGHWYFTNVILRRASDANLIVNGAVTADKIAANSITATNGKIQSIDASKIITGTLNASLATIINLNASNINTGSMSGSFITANTITGDRLVADAITSREIASKTITANEIASNTITAGNLASGTITSDSACIGSLNASKITTGMLDASKISVINLTAGALRVTDTPGFTVDAHSLTFDNYSTIRGFINSWNPDPVTAELFPEVIMNTSNGTTEIANADLKQALSTTEMDISNSLTRVSVAGTGAYYPLFMLQYDIKNEYENLYGNSWPSDMTDTEIDNMLNQMLGAISIHFAAEAFYTSGDTTTDNQPLKVSIYNGATEVWTTLFSSTTGEFDFIKNVSKTSGLSGYVYGGCLYVLISGTVNNYDAQGIYINSVSIKVDLNSYTETGTTLIDATPDINGGRIYIYNDSGVLNATIGSSGFSAGNMGGTLILSDNSGTHKVEAGISSQYNTGLINVYGSSTDYAATLYANNQGNGPTVYLKNGTDYSALTSSDLYVERNQIVSNGHLYHIGRGSAAYTTSVSLDSNDTTTITHSLGYYPIVQLDGNTGNNVLTIYHNSTSQLTIRNYSSGGNSWSGTVRLY